MIQERFDGGFVAANTWGVDGLVSRRENNLASTFYLYDERGNVSERLDINRSVRSTDSYDAYGTRTGTVAQTDPWGYEAQAGYYCDTETGLVLCTHRFYDPGNGRFLTRDPMGYGGGVSLYGYVQNDPINEDDPRGYEGSETGNPIVDILDGDPVHVGGGLAYCFQEVAGIRGELNLMNEPNPSPASILYEGIGGILTGTGGIYGGIAAIGTGALATGVVGSIILSGGIVLVAVGVIAVGVAIYNHNHPSKEESGAEESREEK